MFVKLVLTVSDGQFRNRFDSNYERFLLEIGRYGHAPMRSDTSTPCTSAPVTFIIMPGSSGERSYFMQWVAHFIQGSTCSPLATTNSKNLKSMLMSTKMMFMVIMYMNMTGMPYMFSVTSHIIFTMSFGLPMWLHLILSTMALKTKNSMAHMLPDWAPLWLNPFLIMIELTSVMIRPMTLSFRLMANMTAGHVILSLISSFSASYKMNMFFMLTTITMMYIMFELMICMIQAYIFCLLLSLYSNDHM